MVLREEHKAHIQCDLPHLTVESAQKFGLGRKFLDSGLLCFTTFPSV
jgi:hypothetical protein